MAELRDLLERRAREWHPAAERWERLERRVRRRRRNRRLAAAVLAIAPFLGAMAWVSAVFHARVEPANQPAPAVEVIHLPGPVYGVTTGYGSAWVQVLTPLPSAGTSSGRTGSAATLERVDLATGRILAAIRGEPLPPLPADPGSLTSDVAMLPPSVGAGGVWVVRPLTGSRELIQRIDPRSNGVAASLTVARPCCDAVTAGPAGVWTTAVSRTRPALARLDARSARVVGDVALGEVTTTSLLGETSGTVWVVVRAGGPAPAAKTLLLRISVDTGAFQAVAAPREVSSVRILAAAGSVWVGEGNSILWVDASSGGVRAILPVGARVQDLAFGGGSLWALAGRRILRLDPATGRVIAALPARPGTFSIAYGGGAIWATSPGARTLTRIAVPACPGSGCPAPSPRPAPAGAIGPVWLSSTRMVTPDVGWALAWSGNPGASTPVSLEPVRTTDGGRTWRVLTPPAAGPLLASQNAGAVLFALDSDHAWLAVTRSDAGRPPATTVFSTADGGGSWVASRPFRSLGQATDLAFVDASHGWLLADLGAAMGSDAVAVFRTSDGGRRWSPVAHTPPLGRPGGGSGGLPLGCDKTGMSFATASTGWVTGHCNGGGPYLFATHDAGLHWTSSAATLPLPASSCGQGCGVWPVASLGDAQILLLSGSPNWALLATRNAGGTWRVSGLPASQVAPSSPTALDVSFPDAEHGFLLGRATPHGLGGLLETSDGGATWRRVRTNLPDLSRLEQFGALDFVTPTVGFAWERGTDATGPTAPPLFETRDGGRTWTAITPWLVR